MIEALAWAWEQAVSPTARLILIAMIDGAGTAHEIRAKTGLARSTVYETLKELEAHHLLAVGHRGFFRLSDKSPVIGQMSGKRTRLVRLSDKAGAPPSEPAEDKFGPQDVVDGWNEICCPAGLARVHELTRFRKTKLLLRLKEHPNQEFWDVAMQRVTESPLCCGHVSGWKADFNWLIKNEDNAVKAFEGSYAQKAHYNGRR